MDKLTFEIFDAITCETLKTIVHDTADLLDGADVELLISSYGGEILPTIGIIETLKRFHTHAKIIGFACSSAAILAISCDKCSMSETSSMLLHSVWSENCATNDPGIEHCNELQLKIIKNRCPTFKIEDIKQDNWLSAMRCLELNLVDDINTLDAVDYAALCKKYAAKLAYNFNSSYKEHIMTENIKSEKQMNEVIEEVKEEVKEDEPTETLNDHDLLEVIEKLSEELNSLKTRVTTLEEVKEEVKEEETGTSDEKERINALYKSIVAPQAHIAIGTPKCAAQKVIHKVDYKSFGTFIND